MFINGTNVCVTEGTSIYGGLTHHVTLFHFRYLNENVKSSIIIGSGHQKSTVVMHTKAFDGFNNEHTCRRMRR